MAVLNWTCPQCLSAHTVDTEKPPVAPRVKGVYAQAALVAEHSRLRARAVRERTAVVSALADIPGWTRDGISRVTGLSRRWVNMAVNGK